MIEGVIFTPLYIVDTEGGDVLHAMKSSDPGYSGFGEAYFSTVESNAIKGWKLHREMVLNLVVPKGAIRFVIFDERPGSPTKKNYNEIILSRVNYGRLTIPSQLWVGFQGIDEKTSLLLNIANIQHDPNEIDRKELGEIVFDWR